MNDEHYLEAFFSKNCGIKLLDNFFAISQLFVFGDMVDFFQSGSQMCTNVKIVGVIAKISVYFIFCLCVYVCMYVVFFLHFLLLLFKRLPHPTFCFFI